MELRVGISQAAIEQWGINTGGAVRTSTLPIPFTNVFLAVASTSSEWCCPGCSATNTTVTTRAYQSNRPDVAQPNDVNWIIIGCQPQWGIKTEPYGLVTFPISFQTCFGVITHFNSDPTNYAETSSVTNFSNTDFYVVFYFNNSGSNAAGSQVFWVAIGNS